MSTVFQVVYLPTNNVCVEYDTREEAEDAVAWYERTYGPMQDEIGVREVPEGVTA